jgi:branched-chain amino acid transport system ATP-binding protein
MLILENITAGYDGALALRNVSLKVNSGEIVAIIGANGAGKSTTLLTISGLVGAISGSINFNGHSLVGLTPDRIVQLGLVHVPEGRRVFPDLTIEENLRVAAYLVKDRKLIKNTLSKVYEHFPRLKERRLQSAGTLSGGEQQMLAFGRAMMSQPKMLMLDEPSLGLAPLLVEEVMLAVQMLSDSGITVLLVEQNANLALKIAHRGYVMETGVILMEGTGNELLSNDQVRGSYLGIKLKDD